MPPVPFADNFLAGSILSILLPGLVLIAIVIWYVLTVLRGSGTRVTEVVEDLDRVVNPDPSAASGGGADTTRTANNP
jgi:hypothetical protein